MNHGSIGYITQHGNLHLADNLIKDFCLRDGSKLYGVYYPFPKTSDNTDYLNATLRNDFMLSPIPSRLWPVSARVYVHLKHTEEAIKKFMSFLAANDISIVHAKCTRSGYRYVTWSLNIAFEKLASKELTYIDERNYFLETHHALEGIKKAVRSFVSTNSEHAIKEYHTPDLAKELSEVLFAPKYLKPIWGGDNSRLAFFAHCIEHPEHANWIKTKWPMTSFKLQLSTKDHRHVFDSEDFSKVLDYISQNEGGIIKPSTVYTEHNTDTLSARISIIPEEDRKRFFALGLTYSVTDRGRCVGVIKKVVEEFPPNYKVWNFYNDIRTSDENSDSGCLNFVIEATLQNNLGSHRTLIDYKSEAQSVLSSVIKKNIGKATTFDEPKVETLIAPTIISNALQINTQKKPSEYDFDVFISYSHKDKTFVDDTLIRVFNQYGIKYAIDSKFLDFGNRIEPEILRKILACRTICSVVTINSIASEWVTKERAAAWVLDKDLVPLIIEQNFDVPSWASDIYYVKAYDENQIVAYAERLIAKRLEKEGLNFMEHFSPMV